MGNTQRNFESAPGAPRSPCSLSSQLALGAGCYWGTEKYIRKDFQKKFPGSVKSVTVGFMAPTEPKIKNPSYQQVYRGDSGHIEVAFVELNNPEQHFEELIRFFFQFHDPTTKNRQGNDVGFQYASWIFCADEYQVEISKRVVRQLQSAVSKRIITAYANSEVSTQITAPLTEFTPAHAEHQEYLMNNPLGYCNHRMRFREWPMTK